MSHAYLVDGIRTPFGRYGGALAEVRTDDLAAHVLRDLTGRQPAVDWAAVDDVILGCANQAGEDNRNVARMATLLAGLPVEVPATTVNRLCGSSLDAVAMAARTIRAGDADLIIAGGVESMTRAPFVLPKAATAWSRSNEIHDTTIGWRFINPKMAEAYGTDAMPQTAQTLADELGISREDQDAFALRSQERAAKAIATQSLAVLRTLGLPDDAEHVNPNGGAIALGHPLRASGARLVFTAALELSDRGARRALATMCIGVGQGISLLLESA